MHSLASNTDKFLKVDYCLGEVLRSKVSLCLFNISILSLLIIALSARISRVESQFYYYPEAILDPSSPTVFENTNITVSYFFGSYPPHVEEFGPLTRDGDTFSINVTIFVPAPWDIVLFIVHTDSHTYSLGNLSGGEYEFQVIVHHIHYTEGMSYLGASKMFTVFAPNWNIADINQDLKVDIGDIILAFEAYDSTPEEPNWNPLVDVAPQWDRIDILDLVTIAYHYGEEFTP